MDFNNTLDTVATISATLTDIHQQGVKVQDSMWGILTAVGTVGATLAALFATFWPSLKNWWKRPNLRFEFANEEPFCRHPSGTVNIATGQATKLKSYYLRPRVKNVGHSVARACKAKLVAIAHKDLGTLRQDFDPVTLHWVGNDEITYTYTGNNQSIHHSQSPAVDINSKEYEYIDLISTSEQSGYFRIGTIGSELPRGINTIPQRDDYYLLVTVYAENTDPISEVFKVSNNEKYDKVTLEVATPKDKQKMYQILG